MCGRIGISARISWRRSCSGGRWLHREKDSVLYLPRDFTLLPGVRQVFRGDLLGLSRHYGLA